MTKLAPEREGVGNSSYSFLPLFIPLIWVSLFTVPNKHHAWRCEAKIKDGDHNNLIEGTLRVSSRG